ncbi:hypothetical protein CDL12_02160 [Handroanthus impetiginosus]|uniref:Uncharacterized protein n=1 Tax=Handroanthus impetiginosus TaxID=429701 RepID=A0A2G9I5Q9_9LAMI|nr:hypothetical protein CDL12_02160 [Handroanthus impetiginosus]
MLDVNQSNFGLFKQEGATKTTKLKVRDVFHLPLRVQIVVQFDEQFAPCGEEQGILAGFCGSLATDSSMFPINFKIWRNMPKSYLDHCWDNAIKVSESMAKRYVLQSNGKKWVANRLTIWNEFYDPTKGRNELISNVPNGIGRDQWATYVDHRLHPETQTLCIKNAERRKKQIVTHTGGSKSNVRRRREMLIECGHLIGRGHLFLATYKHQDGSWTLGKEHPRRVRCMGLTVTPTSSFGNTSLRLRDRLGQLESQLKSTLNAFKTYILIKE